MSDYLTDAGDVGYLISDEDIYSVSEPDSRGKVRAVVNFNGQLMLIEGRRIFESYVELSS